MIALLTTLSLAWLPMQQSVQHELQLHSIEGLIDIRAEQRNAIQSQMALDLMAVALAQQAKKQDGLDALGGLLAGKLIDEVAKNSESIGVDSRSFGAFDLAMDETDSSSAPFQSADDLVKNIRTFMQPKFEKGVQSLKIDRSGETRVLLAYLQPIQQTWLTNFLELQRSGRNWQASFKAQLFSGTSNQQIQSLFQYSNATSITGIKHFEAIRDSIQQSGFEILSAPSMLTLPGQTGTITVQKQIAYVADWEVRSVYPAPNKIADPDIKTVEEGLKLKARAFQVSEELYGINIGATIAKIVLPIPQKQIERDGQKLMVSMPKLTTAEISTSMLLPQGTAGVLLRSKDFEPGKDLLLLIEFARYDGGDGIRVKFDWELNPDRTGVILKED